MASSFYHETQDGRLGKCGFLNWNARTHLKLDILSFFWNSSIPVAKHEAEIGQSLDTPWKDSLGYTAVATDTLSQTRWKGRNWHLRLFPDHHTCTVAYMCSLIFLSLQHLTDFFKGTNVPYLSL